MKGKHIAIIAIVLVAGGAFFYWFQARLTCARNAGSGGSIESQIYRESIGLSTFSEDKYKGCMRTYGF